MSVSRREFLQVLAAAGASGFALPGLAGNAKITAPNNMYDLPKFGNVSIMHFTDCHAQLLPIYFREPNVNIGVGSMKSRPPHLVGKHQLKYYGLKAGGEIAHAFTYLDFVNAAKKYGKIGGFAHLATLVKHIHSQRPNAILLDGGDTWQGSATSLWTKGQDMVDACKLLGVDVMTGHWEFTYGADRVKEVIEKDFKGHIDFVAQNVIDNEWEEPVFKPYVMKEINGVAVAIIGQAFPYTPIANPRYMVPDWSFSIREDLLQKHIDMARKKDGAQIVALLSHNGMDVDIKLASHVSGLDVIFGGHTHDAVPEPFEVKNKGGGKTLVINSGSNGKFLSVLDFEFKNGKIRNYAYSLLPVFSNYLEPDKEMEAYIKKVRRPYEDELSEVLTITDDLLYRRGNFNGTFDQLILDAMMSVQDADLAFSPGFRWGVSALPGDPITRDMLMTQTAITYPTATMTRMTGAQIKTILEDVADNLFNSDPYYQQGGDMVRVGGLRYSIDLSKKIGKRIGDMELNGKKLSTRKKYRVAGWASVQKPREGRPIWEVVEEYLASKERVSVPAVNFPKIKGLGSNPGIVLEL